MQHITIEPEAGFHVLAGSRRSQAATMVLDPGDHTGGPDNRHPSSDQWLYVLSGDGEAVVSGRRTELHPGTLLLIEAGEAHEVRAGKEGPLRTLNVYAEPAY